MNFFVRPTARFVIAALAMATLGACSAPQLHANCNETHACGDEMTCRHATPESRGTCELPCRVDGDCPMGFRCNLSDADGGIANACVSR